MTEEHISDFFHRLSVTPMRTFANIRIATAAKALHL
jgi:hypothetical protein